MVAAGVHAADAIDALPLEKDVAETITSLSQIKGLVHATQEQFWMLLPYVDDDFLPYIHADRTVRAVDWKSKEWPNDLKKQLYAEMESVNSSMYPIYRITVVEARTGELLWYNSLDQLVWQTPAPFDYNPYLFAFEHWSVDSTEALGIQELLWGRSSNIGTEILLLPSSFMESYEEDVALEIQATALAEPMGMAMMSMPATVTNLMMGIDAAGSNEVEVGVFFPSGYTNPVRVYAATSLPDWDWEIHTNITTTGISECIWTNATDGYGTRFWVAARSDVDSDEEGLMDCDEKYLYKTRIDLPDTDGDGLSDFDEIQNETNPLVADSDGDGMSDGAENALAASVATNGSGGVLVLVPQTGWYHAADPDLELVYLGE